MLRRVARTLLLVVFVVAGIVWWRGISYSYVPATDKVISRTRPFPYEADYFGERLSRAEAEQRQLTPAQGLVFLNDETARIGRDAFYGETFGNDVFLTDIMGILDGPLSPTAIALAVMALKGEGTTDLVVASAQDAVIGGRRFRKGEPLHTGIDVPRGAWAPLGMPITFRDGRLRAGITCAACHATVDGETGKVIEGAPNNDLNAGLLLALATNSTPYFMHTAVHPHGVSDGSKLEEAVDQALLQWQPGSFDSMVDLVQATTSMPTSWTLGNHPYSWSGPFAAGPFQGLTAQNNNVHALNSDSLVLADASPVLFGIDKDEYIAIILRNAAHKRFRYDAASGRKPSEFFQSVDPNPGAPGVNEIVVPPTFPKATPLGPDGTLTSRSGQPFWQQMNAMSVWQHTVLPPVSPIAMNVEQARRGEAIFRQAGCSACHAGRFLSDNRVHPAADIGTEPARAQALGKTEMNFAGPILFGFDERVPLRRDAKGLPVPMQHLDPAQLALAWNHQRSGGGYKTPSLVGLYWSAPYLHDAGVPTLKALLDRNERERAVSLNGADPARVASHITGRGHEFWVDDGAGFTPDQQTDVIRWLLTYEPR